MKQYFGNYLGIVISGGEKDPEGRGRTQVFVPHIMPTLYEGWNKEGTDIKFDIIGDGLPTALEPDILSRLQKTLPWAECAAPIIGASPSVKNGSETYRNDGGTSNKEGISSSDLENRFGGSAEDNASFQGLTNIAAQQSFAAGKCGTAVGEILESVYGYSESQIRDAAQKGAGTTRRDGKNYNAIMKELGWTAVKVSKPSDAPSNSLLSYGAVSGNKYGHVEWVGTNSSGQKAYYFGLGGMNGVSTPGGGSRVGARNSGGFSGIAWVPPADLSQAKVVPAGYKNSPYAKLGSQLGINPSSIEQDSAINLKPDGSNPTVSPNIGDISDNELKYMMRVAASESGAGVNSSSSVLNALNNPAQRVGYANGYSGGSLGGLERSGQGVINGGKFTAGAYKGEDFTWNKVDIGFAQTNPQNAQQYGFVNSGSYSNQITGSAVGLRNYLNTRTDGAQIQNAIKNGDFATADRALDNFWFGLGRSGGKTDMAKLESKVNSEYGGDWKAAFEGINSELGDGTNSIAQMSNGEFTPTADTSVAVHNPTPYQMQSGPPTNNQARGMFGYASEGTTVWVFFREGDPHFPVYFAASYGQREWQNMYQYGSPGIGAGVGGKGATPGTEVCDMRLYGGGQRSVQVSDESGLDPDFIHQIYSTNGSNLTFTKDHTEFNSIYDHVNRVLGDHHDITEANKETRVRGDMNTYAEQDVYVTVGNWSDEAVAASDEIQSYINEAMNIKSSYGSEGESGDTTSSSSNENKVTLQSARQAVQADRDKVAATGDNIQNPSGRFALINSTTGAVEGYTNNAPPGYSG